MSEQAEFKVGDVVVLKSGGPAMTVVRRPYEDHKECVECIWFERKTVVERRNSLQSYFLYDNEQHVATFDEALLRRADRFETGAA